MVCLFISPFKEAVGLSLRDDFELGKELQKKYVETQKAAPQQKKKSKPNKLVLGLGIAYEMLQVEKITATIKEIVLQKIKPTLIVMVDDIKNIRRNPNKETSFHRWQVHEKFNEIGKRLRK